MFRFGIKLLFPLMLFGSSSEEIFTGIYINGSWGKNSFGEGTSGAGSSLLATELYRDFLEKFLHDFNIQSVVDAGCGDWEFSQTINWDGIDYNGYDVVESVIKKNQARFVAPNIQFHHVDLLNTKLPSADLLICKDVLQHLTNEDILQLIPQFSQYKYCLITNAVFSNTGSSNNPPMMRGGYRPIDLTTPPFSLKGQKVLTYHADVTKQVLLIIN